MSNKDCPVCGFKGGRTRGDIVLTLQGEINHLRAERDALLDLAETAWGIIANAGGGNWDLETADWREAAERWRDRYHVALPSLPAMPTEGAQP